MRVTTVHGARPVAAPRPLPRPAASTRPPRRHQAVRPIAAAAAAASATDSVDDADGLTDADRAALDAEAAAIAAGLTEAAEEQGGLLGDDATEAGDDGAPTPSSTPRTPLRDLPRVALVGRPNVGKSALFNRLLGTRAAIVHDFPGVTRDALCARAAWRGRDFALVDTGGLAADAAALPGAAGAAATAAATAAGLPAAVERATAAAVAAADAVVVVGDGTTGLTPGETDILTWLRREHARVPTLLAVNKCDNSARAAAAVAEFWEAGVEPWPVSAISGSGTGDLLDAVLGVLPETRSKRKSAGDVDIDDAWWDDHAADGGGGDPSQRPLRVAIVGRPNAGKSSLLNALTGTDRAIVSDVAGTTRDAVDARVTAPDGATVTLVDTAGVRRRTAVAGSPDGAEKLSVGRALAALRRCDVAVLVVDAAACARGGRFVATTQDFRLAELIAAAGRACVIVLNKWDAVTDRGPSTVSDFEADVRASLRPVEWALITHASATARRRVPQVLTAAQSAGAEHGRRLSTATLNLVVRDAVTWRGPPGTKGSPKKGRVYYATQPSTRPPTFVLFVNDPSLFPDDYRRYIERSIRTAAGFQGTAVRVVWRGKPKEAREGGRGERKGGGGRG